ncbi:MAG: Lrp/AsnC family transcriptional regulator [bacterium]|nr:Lrp/AsnC family transcriptional regulator [bacterium]
MNDILKYEPIQRFLKGVGEDVKKYFGKDPGCIVYLQPNGIWYALALHKWLSLQKKNITLLAMQDDAADLNEKEVRGRKVLVVDGDVVTGKAYKRSMEGLRQRKEKLKIKDVKFATYIDRQDLADFSVWKYTPEAVWQLDRFDAKDLQIISFLATDGRMSFAKIGQKVRLSAVSVKNRFDSLKERLLRVRAVLNIDQLYTMAAHLEIEGEEKAISALVEKLENRQEVYHIARVTGQYNLLISFLGRNLKDLELLVEKEVRKTPGINSLRVSIGEIPHFPKTILPRL